MPRGSQQRRRGVWVEVYPSVETVDRRGNTVRIVDEDHPIRVRAAFIPQRSSRAELPGQQDLHVTRMIVSADLAGVDSWGRVNYNGSMWDIVVPPGLHEGTRHTRHWTIDLRQRP